MKFAPSLQSLEVQSALGGKYHNITSIADGEGGQGVVFSAASPTDTQQKLALKIYYPGAVSERSKREIATLKKISCPTLVQFHSEGEITVRGETCTYMATDFVCGESLSVRIKRGGADDGCSQPCCDRRGNRD